MPEAANAAAIAEKIREENFSEAERLVDQLLETEPANAEGWYFKGLIHKERGDRAGAITCFNTALKRQPDYSEACSELAQLLDKTGQTELAIKMHEHWLKIEQSQVQQPSRAVSTADVKAEERWFNKGAALYAKGQLAEAAQAYEKALAINPDRPTVLSNLGLTQTKMCLYAEAEQALLKSLRLKPFCEQTLNVLSAGYQETGQITKALAAARLAVAIKPDFYDALENIAKIYLNSQRYSEALAAFRNVLAVEARLPAQAALVHVLHYLCLWDEAKTAQAQMLEALRRTDQSAEPFTVIVYTPPDLQLANVTRWAASRYPAARPYNAARPLPSARRGDGKLRIGYLSNDFHAHATVHLIGGMFEQHDRSRFDIFTYSYGVDKPDPERQRIRQTVDQFRDVRLMDDHACAEMIERDGVDILVDLKGYTKNHRMRVMALRPAPVQMHYIGYPGTTGIPCIDYFIGDSIASPPEGDRYFTEKLIRLPYSYQMNDRSRPLPKTGLPREAYGLPAEGFVFCDFNSAYKITPEIFAVWMRLLVKVEGSVLWLYETHAEASENLRGEAAKAGIDPARLLFATNLPLPLHLARYLHVDLFLDTAPVCGHTTASDALWCGVPVVALKGDSFISRVAASLLHAVGLPELVAPDLNAYEALALELARDPERLQRLKRHLQDGRQQFPLFDCAATTRALEAAYLHAAECHRLKQAPRAFSVMSDLQIA